MPLHYCNDAFPMQVKSGISEKPSREHTCVSSVSRRFRFAVGRMFVNEYFDVKSKKVVSIFYSIAHCRFMSNLNGKDCVIHPRRYASSRSFVQRRPKKWSRVSPKPSNQCSRTRNGWTRKLANSPSKRSTKWIRWSDTQITYLTTKS